MCIYNIILTDRTAPGASEHPCLLLAHHFDLSTPHVSCLISYFYWSNTGTKSTRAETPNEPVIGGAWTLLMHHVMAGDILKYHMLELAESNSNLFSRVTVKGHIAEFSLLLYFLFIFLCK